MDVKDVLVERNYGELMNIAAAAMTEAATQEEVDLYHQVFNPNDMYRVLAAWEAIEEEVQLRRQTEEGNDDG